MVEQSLGRTFIFYSREDDGAIFADELRNGRIKNEFSVVA